MCETDWGLEGFLGATFHMDICVVCGVGKRLLASVTNDSCQDRLVDGSRGGYGGFGIALKWLCGLFWRSCSRHCRLGMELGTYLCR